MASHRRASLDSWDSNNRPSAPRRCRPCHRDQKRSRRMSQQALSACRPIGSRSRCSWPALFRSRRPRDTRSGFRRAPHIRTQPQIAAGTASNGAETFNALPERRERQSRRAAERVEGHTGACSQACARGYCCAGAGGDQGKVGKCAGCRRYPPVRNELPRPVQPTVAQLPGPVGDAGLN
jgi:hypothetical protein